MDASSSPLEFNGPLTLSAVGACTALAPTLVQTSFLLRRGSLAVREAALLTPDGENFTACALPTLDPHLAGLDRLTALVQAALRDVPLSMGELLRDLRMRIYPLLSRGVNATPSAMGQAADEFRGKLEGLGSGVVHGGTFAGATERDATGLGELLPRISRDLEQGTADVAVVIAAHSDLDVARVRELFDEGRLYTDDNDDGLLLGEAAVVLVLSRPETNRRHKLPSIAQLHAVQVAHDHATPGNDASAFSALALTFATRRALAAAPVTRGKLGWLFSDLNFERYRVSEYQAVLARCQDVLTVPQIHEYPAQRLGSLGCATSPLHLGLAATAWEYGFAPDTSCVSWSGHDDGTRCVIVLSR